MIVLYHITLTCQCGEQSLTIDPMSRTAACTLTIDDDDAFRLHCLKSDAMTTEHAFPRTVLLESKTNGHA